MNSRGRRSRPRLAAILCGLVGIILISAFASPRTHVVPGLAIDPSGAALTGIQKIQHVIVIQQENRSFDEYFGTYPGADGIPVNGSGTPTVCVPDPDHGTCAAPYVDHADNNGGGPHGADAAVADINGGKMDGFVSAAEQAGKDCTDATNPACANGPMDVMGYHTQSDIPNYWSYANNYVLQDHMFEPNASWSLPEHLFLVSEWSARCSAHNDPSTCVNSLDQREPGPGIFGWTDLTYLFHRNSVSWGYYLTSGDEPDCANDDALSCVPTPQSPRTPGIWNPLAGFDTVKNDGELGNIQSVSNFYTAAKNGTLPSVSWVVPSKDNSEHGPWSIKAGQSYVTSVINAVMNSPEWSSTAIFLSWDDWGGYYDHVMPPAVDVNGYGLRVPGLVISPYAKTGFIDHQVLSFDAYAKFIEDDFLGGQRLDPATDGRPDPRPTVRESSPMLGDLTADFNFNQAPRPPTLLPVHPATTLTSVAPFGPITIFASPGNSGAIVQWTAPFTDGGSPITGYQITEYVNGVARSTVTFHSAATIETMRGLRNGVAYTFKASAINSNGVGLASHMTTPIVVGVPAPATNLTATTGNGTVALRWSPAADHGARVTGYIVTLTPHSAALPPRIWHTTGPGIRVTLPNGRTASFRVVATNSRGEGATAISGPFSVGAPLAPANVTAVNIGSGTVRVTFEPSANNGARIGRYTAQCTSADGGISKKASGPRRPVVVSGLTVGSTYRCTVKAENSRGASHLSNPSAPVIA